MLVMQKVIPANALFADLAMRPLAPDTAALAVHSVVAIKRLICWESSHGSLELFDWHTGNVGCVHTEKAEGTAFERSANALTSFLPHLRQRDCVCPKAR